MDQHSLWQLAWLYTAEVSGSMILVTCSDLSTFAIRDAIDSRSSDLKILWSKGRCSLSQIPMDNHELCSLYGSQRMAL